MKKRKEKDVFHDEAFPSAERRLADRRRSDRRLGDRRIGERRRAERRVDERRSAPTRSRESLLNQLLTPEELDSLRRLIRESADS